MVKQLHSINWAQLGRTFAAKRNSMNISQQDASDFLGVTRASIANFERGNQKFPLERLSQLCEKYELSFELFITEGLPCHATALISLVSNMPISVAADRESLIQDAIANGMITSEADLEAKGLYVSQIIWSVPAPLEESAAQAQVG